MKICAKIIEVKNVYSIDFDSDQPESITNIETGINDTENITIIANTYPNIIISYSFQIEFLI